MFFASQKTNKCGLHAIQNVLKSAKITEKDLNDTCKEIHDKTGDIITNHQSFGGDWSVQAVLQTLVRHGYTVESAVSSKANREWSGESIESLLNSEDFRGMIVHQPKNRHFTCLRPENDTDGTHLYYVDSQSDGPKRISPNLASRRCLAEAYSWEPFVIKGPEMERIELPEQHSINLASDSMERPTKRIKRPSEEFMKAWYSLKNQNAETKSTEQTEQSEEMSSNPLVVAGILPVDDDK